jgi:hypothetical protein
MDHMARPEHVNGVRVAMQDVVREIHQQKRGDPAGPGTPVDAEGAGHGTRAERHPADPVWQQPRALQREMRHAPRIDAEHQQLGEDAKQLAQDAAREIADRVVQPVHRIMPAPGHGELDEDQQEEQRDRGFDDGHERKTS